MENQDQQQPPFRSTWRDQHSAEPKDSRSVSINQWRVAAVIVVSTIGSILAWTISEIGLGATGLYFIAIPGFLAAIVTVLPIDGGSQREVGPVRITVICILLSALVVREGFICVLMASPLVLGVVGLVVMVAKDPNKTQVSVVIPLMALIGLEGVAYDLPDQNTAVETRMIVGTESSIDDALSEPGVLPDLEPLLFRLPFPRPTGFEGTAAEIGERQRITFDRGHIDLEVTERSANRVLLTAVEDTTPIANWYAVQTITIDWRQLDPGNGSTESAPTTELRVEIDYKRNLDPAFYFHPLGTFGVGEMAEVVADMVETNR